MKTACVVSIILLAVSLPFSTIIADVSDQSKEYKGVEVLGPKAAAAAYCMTKHDLNRMSFGVTNWGLIGKGRAYYTDCFTGSLIPMGEYPTGSNAAYLYKAGVWVGGVVGRDTIVSTGTIFNTTSREFYPMTDFIRRTSLDITAPDYDLAVSEQDLITSYRDTPSGSLDFRPTDEYDGRQHQPLGIEVVQRSFAWSYEYADDFVLFEFEITNASDRPIESVYIGMYMDADAGFGGIPINQSPPDISAGKGLTLGRDDLVGFIEAVPRQYRSCDSPDTLGIAWTMDGDGDPQSSGEFALSSVTGVMLLGDSPLYTKRSFNWWVFNGNSTLDYGPQRVANKRLLGNGLGTPIGDRARYFLMSNGETDFDQAYLPAIDYLSSEWVSPDDNLAFSLARGGDVQFVYSVGEFNIPPGGSIKVPFAYVNGEDIHTIYFNHSAYLRNRYRPDWYYNNLDFSGLIANATAAQRIYDNPGIDTDSDGYAGQFRTCVVDSIFVDGQWEPSRIDTAYFTGDGIADWQGAAPPPPPYVFVTRQVGAIHIRFNGELSENTADPFSGVSDFEGYRVYIGRDTREGSFTMVGSFDRENYDKLVFRPEVEPMGIYEVVDEPFSLEELRCLYGSGDDPCNDEDFDISLYSPSAPYIDPNFPDSAFYFAAHDYNRWELGIHTPITKVYPNEPKPDPAGPYSPDQFTPEGHLKYYEYEMEITDLLPTVAYYVNVTSFDFGSPQSDLEPLESSVELGAQLVWVAASESELTRENKKVYIYPNPYRIDDPYRNRGFEGRAREDMPDDRVREIHFVNVPSTCTISIFSLDGDLVRRLDHDVPESDPSAHHATWDMITRNTQAPVSGLYYWVVEDPNGETQIGKLVIIK